MEDLLFVDDRPCSPLRPCTLNEALFRRTDIRPTLLRSKDEDLAEYYLRLTENIAKYYVDTSAPVAREVASFRSWCGETGVAPAHFCCPSEPRQEFWQSFARELGLPALEAETTRALRHKPTMKAWLRRAGFRTAEYAEVSTADDVIGFAELHGYPIVMKPVAGWGALETSVLLDRAAVWRSPPDQARRQMMVETYIADPEYECCALVADGRVLDVYPSIMPAPPVEAAAGAINANISVGNLRRWVPVDNLHDMIQRLVDVFRLQRGYLHMEFFASADGQRLTIGELALRFPGCEIAKNHGLALNFDIANATLDLYLGRKPSLEYGVARCVGDLLLPYRAGRVVRVSTECELRVLPGVLEAHVGVHPGEDLPAQEPASFNCSGWVFVEGASPGEVESRMRAVLAAFVLQTVEY